jgi:hypothetical protein
MPRIETVLARVGDDIARGNDADQSRIRHSTVASITGRIAGDTDLASAKPGVGSTTILCNEGGRRGWPTGITWTGMSQCAPIQLAHMYAG